MKQFLNQKLLPVGVPNHNGRIYPESELRKCINNESLKIGMLGMGESFGAVDLQRVSHEISNVRIENGWLVCDAKVLHTPCGSILDSLDENEFYFATAGFGDIDENNVVSNFQPYAINVCMKQP